MKKLLLTAALAAFLLTNADAGTISWKLGTQHEIENFQTVQNKFGSNPNNENKMLFIMMDMSYGGEEMINQFMKLNLYLLWSEEEFYEEHYFPPSILNPDCIMGTWEADLKTMSPDDVYETGEIADGAYNVVVIAVWLDSKNILADYWFNTGPLPDGPLPDENSKWYDYYTCVESYQTVATTGMITGIANFSEDIFGACTLDQIPLPGTNIPEPATGLLAMLGGALLLRRRRREKAEG